MRNTVATTLGVLARAAVSRTARGNRIAAILTDSEFSAGNSENQNLQIGVNAVKLDSATRKTLGVRNSLDANPAKATAGSINLAAKVAAKATAAAKLLGKLLPLAKRALDAAYTEVTRKCKPHFLTYARYFDERHAGSQPAYVLDGFTTINAAIAKLYGVAETSPDFKAAINQTTYRRNIGCDLLGINLGGLTKTGKVRKNARTRGSKHPTSLVNQVLAYLKTRLPKLSVNSHKLIAEAVGRSWSEVEQNGVKRSGKATVTPARVVEGQRETAATREAHRVAKGKAQRKAARLAVKVAKGDKRRHAVAAYRQRQTQIQKQSDAAWVAAQRKVKSAA